MKVKLIQIFALLILFGSLHCQLIEAAGGIIYAITTIGSFLSWLFGLFNGQDNYYFNRKNNNYHQEDQYSRMSDEDRYVDQKMRDYYRRQYREEQGNARRNKNY